MVGMKDKIEVALKDAFAPTHLNVQDVSESHRGHAGFQEGGESHFDVVIRSAAFEGMSRLAQHRAIHKALGPDIVGAIHALALDVKSDRSVG